MYGIMHASIQQVAKHKTGKKHECVFLYKGIHQHKNGGGENDAWDRRHKQALSVTRVFMVVAMHYVNNLSRALALGNKMKKKPVHDILKKSPEENARYKCQ